MSITAITIENFKGIKEPVTVEIKPITLLFGPNSAGKSTIVQALHYAREIFERKNLNPDRTLLGGNSVDLGGFANFVHNHDLDRPVRLRFDFRFDRDNAFRFPCVANGLIPESEECEHFLNFYWAEDVLEPWLEISVRWSSLVNRPVLTTYRTGFGASLFAEIRTTVDGKQKTLSFLDINSPVFMTEEGINLAISYLHSAMDDETSGILNLNVDTQDALPRLPGIHFPDLQPLSTGGIEETFLFEEKESFIGLLSSLLISPVEYLIKELQRFCYLGPLRAVPKRGHLPANTQDAARWSNGLAAYDALFFSDDVFLGRVNEWLTREDRLNSGYSVEVKTYRELEEDDPLMLALLQDRIFDEDIDLRTSLLALPVKRRLLIRDEARDIELAPQDIGVGISQVLPVVVAALYRKAGIVATEQPELHIHPAFQVALGDLFIEQIRECPDLTFILETHSEHLMLRLLRRIRETGEGEAPQNRTLTPDELSIYFIEQGETGISCYPIRVDEDGDFIDRWPRGFFNERAEELF